VSRDTKESEFFDLVDFGDVAFIFMSREMGRQSSARLKNLFLSSSFNRTIFVFFFQQNKKIYFCLLLSTEQKIYFCLLLSTELFFQQLSSDMSYLQFYLCVCVCVCVYACVRVHHERTYSDKAPTNKICRRAPLA